MQYATNPMKELDEEEYLDFYEEWLELDKYNFKILTIITVYSDNQKAFRGKLADFCKELAIQDSSNNKDKVEEALMFLVKSDYISIILDQDIYTITLKKIVEENKNIIKFKREWYKLIRETKESGKIQIAWESILKVFLVLLELPQGKDFIITNKQIGEMVHCSESTVQRAVKVICKIDFKDFQFVKNVVKVRDSETGNYRTIGTIYTQVIFFK